MDFLKMVLSTGGVTVIAMAVGILFMLTKCYRMAEQGTALVRNGMGGTQVSFSGMIIFPVIHHLEIMDISVKRINIDRLGNEALLCRDGKPIELRAAFFLRILPNPQDVRRAADSVGCKVAGNAEELANVFAPRFLGALKTAAKAIDYADACNNANAYKDAVLKQIGIDLNGFVLDDLAIDVLEKTPEELAGKVQVLDKDAMNNA